MDTLASTRELPLCKLQNQIAVERVLGELRAARPVAIRWRDSLVLAFPVEGLTNELMPLLQELGRRPRLVIPGERVRRWREWTTAAAAISIESATLETIKWLTGQGMMKGAHSFKTELKVPGEAETAALALANLSFLMPAVIVADGRSADLELLPILCVAAEDALKFRDRQAKILNIVARTQVPLDGAGLCEFVVFRGGDGFRDQIAVIVGDPSPKYPVLARIHSACLTGDLFGSLKYDCGDQLRGTVRAMSERGGGIVLYLDQEGRGGMGLPTRFAPIVSRSKVSTHMTPTH